MSGVVRGYTIRGLSLAFPLFVQFWLFSADGDGFVEFNYLYGLQNVFAHILLPGFAYRSYRAGGGFETGSILFTTAILAATLSFIGGFVLVIFGSSFVGAIILGSAIAGSVNVKSEELRGRLRIEQSTVLSQVAPWITLMLILLLFPDVDKTILPVGMYSVAGPIALWSLVREGVFPPSLREILRDARPGHGFLVTLMTSARSNAVAIGAGLLTVPGVDVALLAVKVNSSMQSAANYGTAGNIRSASAALREQPSDKAALLRTSMASTTPILLGLSTASVLGAAALNWIGLIEDSSAFAVITGSIAFALMSWSALIPQIAVNVLTAAHVATGAAIGLFCLTCLLIAVFAAELPALLILVSALASMAIQRCFLIVQLLRPIEDTLGGDGARANK